MAGLAWGGGSQQHTGEWGPSREAWPLGDFILFFVFFFKVKLLGSRCAKGECLGLVTQGWSCPSRALGQEGVCCSLAPEGCPAAGPADRTAVGQLSALP